MSGVNDIREAVMGSDLANVADSTPASPADIDLRLASLSLHDVGSSKRFIARNGRDFIWIADSSGRGTWYVWKGTHWNQEDGEREAQLRAQATAAAILDEVAALRDAGPQDAESREAWQKRITELGKWAKSSGYAARLDAMLTTVAPQLERRSVELDANPWLFNVRNGTVELHAEADGGVTFRAHRRDDLITRVAPVSYDPNAECPDFRAWLEGILPDPKVCLFLQRYFGYALSGAIDEQCMVMFWGKGQNGKSTLLNVVRSILGAYCVILPVASLLEQQYRRGSDATPELARLAGARLALASEPEKKERLSASAIKTLTGGEPIAVRALYRGFVEFVPEAKLVLTVNEKPTVSAQDHGMWRRLLLVEFGVQIPTEKLIGRFEQVLLREDAGILNWLLDGFRLWREGKLAVPDAIRTATDEYRSDQDFIGQFLEAAVIRSKEPDSCVSSVQLWHAYLKWCRENAVDATSRNTFGRSLKSHGLRRGKSSNIVYRGIELSEAYKVQEEMDVGDV